MARVTQPDDSFDPRHRIVGAIILVSAAVILLPLVLDDRPVDVGVDQVSRTATTPGTAAPTEASSANGSVDEAPAGSDRPAVQTRVVSLTSGAEPSRSPSGNPAGSKDSSTPKDKPVARVESPKPVAVAKTPTKQEAAKSKTQVAAARSGNDWTVQVGTFSNPGNVRRLGKQLKERGFAVLYKDVSLKQGNAVRIRVGPFASKATANKARQRINKEIGVNSVVVAGP